MISGKKVTFLAKLLSCYSSHAQELVSSTSGVKFSIGNQVTIADRKYLLFSG